MIVQKGKRIKERVSMKHNDYSVGYRIDRYLQTTDRGQWFRWNDDKKRLIQMMFNQSRNPSRPKRSSNEASKEEKNWMNWGIGLKKVDWEKWIPGSSMIPLVKIMDTVIPFNLEGKKKVYRKKSIAASLKRFWIHNGMPYAGLAWSEHGHRGGWPEDPQR